MATTRINQLRKLAAAVPGQNEQIAQGLQAARETQLQETIRQARPAGPMAAQQIGAQQAAQAGQIQLQQAQQTQQDLQRLGQTAAQQTQLEAQQRVGQAQRAVSGKARELENKLAKLNQEVKNELLDKQLEFNKDERGRTIFNERQLADWAIQNAKSEEEFLNYKQAAEQMHQRKMQMLEVAYQKLSAQLRGEARLKGQKLDQESRNRIEEARRKIEQKLRQEQIEEQNRQAIWSGVGTIVGAGVGAFFGGPGGASAGAQAGGSAGAGAGTLAG